MRSLFSFPKQVNETSARLVAAGVVLQCVVFVVTREWWLLIPLAYGFAARVLTGPKLSPLGQFVTRVVTPRLDVEHRIVPGPPKRFAQSIGATLSVAALVANTTGAHLLAVVLVVGIAGAATLESALAVCVGCIIFNRLMRWGMIPAHACESCNDISDRGAAGSAATT